MIMDASHYLPFEVLSYTNFPEVERVARDIELIFDFAMQVDSATLQYNQGVVNRINVNDTDIEAAVARCRKVCEVLGTAPNVCYDILRDLRTLQAQFQELLFLKRRYGDEYIGVPTAVEDFGDEGGIG